MSMKRTPEWYAEYQARVAHNNVDLVKLRRGDKPGVPPHPVPVPVAAAPLVYPVVRLCRDAGLPEPAPEYRFHATRKWRFDYAWPLHKLACEIDGGIWSQGRHTRGAGRIADMEKQSEAAILGWRIVYATPQELESGVLLGRLMRALNPTREAA